MRGGSSRRPDRPVPRAPARSFPAPCRRPGIPRTGIPRETAAIPVLLFGRSAASPRIPRAARPHQSPRTTRAGLGSPRISHRHQQSSLRRAVHRAVRPVRVQSERVRPGRRPVVRSSRTAGPSPRAAIPATRPRAGSPIRLEPMPRAVRGSGHVDRRIRSHRAARTSRCVSGSAFAVRRPGARASRRTAPASRVSSGPGLQERVERAGFRVA